MADNEKLVFQIGFDLDSAVKDATSEWKRVQRELEAAINARPISISMDTRGLERFNTFVERTYASLEDLQDLFPEVFKETKDGEGITKRFQAMETSINAVSKEMRNLEKVWNNLSQAEKFDDDGNLTERAQELKRAYVELYQSQKTQGQTLQEITKEAINLANQEYEAQQRKKKQEEDFIRLLNLEETTLEKLQAKLGAWKQKLSQTEIGTSDWSNAIAEVQRLETKIKDLQKQIKGVATETKKTSKTKVDIDTSTFAGKLKDLENRWKALNAEQRKGAEGQALRAEWRKLSEEAGRYTSTLRSAVSAEDRLANAKKKTTQATHEQNSAYKTQGGYLSRLFQRMVAYASVAQAFSFVRNVRDVTAEFELQRVALGSIIGDLNEANAMFEQIKAAAVKSPFQIKELVTYTKQLAAYKIETDELFETTQRLADISAGLGVGMERLVLAYGQIRATGYLRASEVRQLTEAGIPIVEELAKKMSQLRGETVSAAEVMGMISERAISFGMVKEVFDDMTSAGGMFYKMQEKQAETLAGQWSNLQDSISIMYEEIGNTESVNNVMKGTIGLVKSLAENWRTVAVVMVTALEGYGVYKGFSALLSAMTFKMVSLAVATKNHEIASNKATLAIARFGKVGRLMTWHLTKQTKLLKQASKETNFWRMSLLRLRAFLAGNIWNIALIGIGALVSWIVSATIETNRLNKELARIGAEGDAQSRQQVQNFDRLARVIRNSVDGSKEQSDALKEMKRAYGDLLPNQDAEIRNLLRTEEGYNNVANAIRQKIALQTQEQKINAITSDRTKVIGEAQSEVRPFLEREGYSPETINKIFEEISRAINDGRITITKDIKANADAINRVLGDVGIELDLARLVQPVVGNDYWTASNRTAELIFNIAEAEAELKSRVDEVVKSMENQTLQLGEYTEKYKEFKEGYGKIPSPEEQDSFELSEDMSNQRIEYYKTFIQQLLAEAKSLGEDEGGISEETYTRLLGLDNLDKVMEELGDRVPTMSGILQELRRGFTNLVPTQEMEVVKRSIMSISSATGVSMDLARRFLMQNGETTEQWRKRIHEEYENAKKDVASLRILLGQAIAMSAETSEIEDALQKAEDIEKVTAEIAKAYAIMNNSGRGGRGGHQKDAWVATMEERIKYMKDFQQGVEKLSKTMSRASAIEREQMIMLNRGIALGLNPKELKGSTEELLVWYEKSINDTVAKIQKFKGFRGLTVEQILSTKTKNKTIQEYQALLQSLYNSMTDFETSQVAKEMEKKLKKLSNDISRTKTAKEFFDRMLGLTGDKELSATLTLSVYGTTGDDLQKLMTQQVTDAFRGVDITSAMLGGGKFDYNILDNLVEKLPESQQKNAQSIVDNWRKANADILTDLQKSYEDFMTYEERKTRVVERQIAERKKIEETQYDDDEKAKLIKASEKSRDRELADIAIEEFKASEDWAKSFEDLENLATSTIERLMTKLKEFIDLNKEDMTPEQVKTLTKEYQKLYDGLIQRNPFKAISDGVKEYKMSIQGIKLAQEQLTTAIALGDEELIAFAERGLTDAFDEAQKASTKLKKGVDAVGDQFSQAASDIQFFANALGFSEDSYATQFLNGMANAFKGVSIAIGFADIAMKIFDGTIKGMLASNPIGWILLAVSAIISAVQAIMNARINRINKEIEALEDKLDNLEYAYDRLQKSAERAFGTEYIQNYQRQLDNLEAQVEAYEKQLNAERSKGKKSDEEKITEYQEQIQDTKDAIEDMYGSLSEHFLGQDLTSAARDFASAWIDAYKGFANTTDAMKAKFQDMIQNMIVESLIAKVMERALKPVFDMVDNMGDSDFYSNSFWSQLMTEMNKATENGVVGAQNIMGMLENIGINLRDTGTGLTGISRDIATASEESILGLAAGINTQNFYISQVPTKLDTIIGLLRGGSAVVDSGVNVQDLITIQNQFLSHLPTIAQNTAETVARCERAAVACENMASKLGSVIKPKGTTSTHSVNVTIGS